MRRVLKCVNRSLYKIRQNVDMGLEGMGEKEATGAARCTNMLPNFSM